MIKPRDARAAIKRALDIAGASIGLVLLAPVLAAVATLVATTSRGPVLYRGERTGRYGKTFRILKFRTMRPDAERTGSPTTSSSDPRITPVGHALRRYKLDELPQLFNVLAGSMSFVGPRPEVTAYLERMSPAERVILSVRPGITDLASLRFHDLQSHVGADDPERVYQQTVLPEKRRLQIEYVNEWCLALDAKILARTVWLVVRKPWTAPKSLQNETPRRAA